MLRTSPTSIFHCNGLAFALSSMSHSIESQWSNTCTKKKMSYRFGGDFWSETFRNPLIERGLNEYKKVCYFRKADFRY